MLCPLLIIAGVSAFTAFAPTDCVAPAVLEGNQVAVHVQEIGTDQQRLANLNLSFNPVDSALLEEIQKACFLYFWNEVGDPAPLVKDRLKSPVSSIAAVGFQLSSLPIGVEHGWISRAAGQRRALLVLRALIRHKGNRRAGIYLHFPDHNSGGISRVGYEQVASTVDTALFIAGAITAGQYFGGDVLAYADHVVREADWRSFATTPEGFLSMGWRPANLENMNGPGQFLPHCWHDAGDEERLVYFLAVASPNKDRAVSPEVYYRLKREVRSHADLPPYVVTWPGALFTYFFSHCWIEYRLFGLDDPSAFGINTIPVDWYENSRRAVLTHRARCMEQSGRFSTLSENVWGLSACVGRDGYIVPRVGPNLAREDKWYFGTVAPYAAGSAIMFAATESVAALRAMRTLADPSGRLVAWRDPADGGYGFVDAFNLDQAYASDDYVGIDQGPMLLAIENARTGLIWRLFMQSRTAQLAVERLRFVPRQAPSDR